MPERMAHSVDLSVYCGDGECNGHSLSSPVKWGLRMIRKQSDKGRKKERAVPRKRDAGLKLEILKLRF